MATFIRDPKSGVIYMHQFVDSYRFRVSTKVKVTEKKNWGKGKATNNLVLYNGKSVNSQIKQCELYLNEALADLRVAGGDINTLKKFYHLRCKGKSTISPNDKKFMQFFKEYYEKEQERDSKTWKHYRTTYNTLHEFFNGKDPGFDFIDMDFYRDFSSWMETKKDYKISNIGAHWKRIKVVMRAAEEKKVSTNRIYEKFKKESYTTDNIALSDAELQKLEKVKLPNKEFDGIRDHFLLACYTGARISDWGRLHKSDIVNGIWKYTAHKTREVCRVRISPKVIAILDKHNDKMPDLPNSDQVVNENIRAICQLAKIDTKYTQNVIKGGKLVTDSKPRYKLVTSHTGRRTFATRLILQGVPVHLVMAQTGHKTLSSFESYIKLKELQTDQALQDLNIFV